MKVTRTCIFLLLATWLVFPVSAQTRETMSHDGKRDRKFFVASLTRIADPVLQALSRGELKKKMPVEAKSGQQEDRRRYTYLEAMGRLLDGMAPWLELGPDQTPEGRQRAKYLQLALQCIRNGTDPSSPDFMNFDQGAQPLVDAAFLAHALTRAPKQLWGGLDQSTRAHVISALKSTRVIKPYNSNWLFFSAMVEAALLKFTGSCEMGPITRALDMFTKKWYLGDGIYGDGKDFHWDYYNSYVIQPMFLDVLGILMEASDSGKKTYGSTYQVVLKRARRYAYIQESLISPEGTYPPLGRSLAYRFGSFQLLSQIALMRELPASLTPQQVRAALYAVIRRQLKIKGTFDAQGWLQIGMAGHQPAIGENYISTGSLYLCSEAFLVLGLPPDHAFWTGKDEDWTSRQVWSGQNIPIEHALDQ